MGYYAIPRMCRIYSFFLIIIVSCADQPKNRNDLQTHSSEVWKVFKTKDSIPKHLYHAFTKINGEEFKIADPDEEWQKTDVIWSDSIPTRQLIFIANKGVDWRISYIQGGFAKHYVFAQFQIFGDTLKNLKGTTTNLKIGSNDSVNVFIKNKKLIISKD